MPFPVTRPAFAIGWLVVVLPNTAVADDSDEVDLQWWSLVNDVTSFYQRNQSPGSFDTEAQSAVVEVSSALRLGGFSGATLENSLEYAWDADGIEATSSLRRNQTRLIYEKPDTATRFQVGDIFTTPENLQGSTDLLGFSIGTAFDELQPERNIRTAGERLLILKRRTLVQVLADGVIVDERFVAPGQYSVSDFAPPDTPGNVTLNIRDDRGNFDSFEFGGFGSAVLLEPGVAEWNFYAGVQSSFGIEALEYDTSAPVAGGFLRRGLSPNLTLGLDFQYAEELSQLGISMVRPLLGGISRTGIAGSATEGDIGLGISVSQDWQELFGGRGFLNISGLYYSDSFRIPGFSEPIDFEEEFGEDPDFEIREPRGSAAFTTLPFQFEGIVDGSLQLTNRISANIGGLYRLPAPSSEDQSDEWAFSGGASLRISRRFQLRFTSSVSEQGGERSRSLIASLQFRPTQLSRVTARYSAPSERFRTTLARSPKRTTDAINYSIAIDEALVDNVPRTAILNAEFLRNRGILAVGGRQAIGDRSQARGDFLFVEAETSLIMSPDYAGIAQSAGASGSYVAVKPRRDGSTRYVRGYSDDGKVIEDYSARTDAFGAGVASDVFSYASDIVSVVDVDRSKECVIDEIDYEIVAAYRTVVVIHDKTEAVGERYCLYGDDDGGEE